MQRKNTIYGNYQVYSPDGILMFRCEGKKAKWYLNRNLAVIIDNNPLTIQLTFVPNGKGEKNDALKAERANICVVCGHNNINELTKHHLVPYEYRKFLKDDKKQHSSSYIVPLCEKCHMEYNKYAVSLRKELEAKCNAPKNSFSMKNIPALKAIRAILNNYDRMPEQKINILKDIIRLFLIENNISGNVDTIEDIQKIYSLFHHDFENIPHGKNVIAHYKDNLDTFEKIWIKDFIDNMKPKYMPNYINHLF